MGTPTPIILGPGATFACGCHVAMRGDEVLILYCPTHRADVRMRETLNDITAALGTIVQNGRQIADPRMDGATDVYAVPLDDLERAHEPLTRSRALLRELGEGG